MPPRRRLARRRARLTVAALVPALAGAAAHAAGDAVDGSGAFAQNCQMCHQSGALGLAGSFPRLAGRVAAISAKPQGRAYLVDVLTYGMVGTISVDRQPLTGLMPPFGQLPAEQVATILSYLQTLGDAPAKTPAPFTAEEIVTARARPPKTAADVLTERQGLVNAKVVP